MPGRIVSDNRSMRACYHDLEREDLILGQLNLKQCEEHIFLDLLARGINMVPHALSQQISRSKCMQALIYAESMIPGTAVIRSRKDLELNMQAYARSGTVEIITKEDRGDCGTGIHLWRSTEDLYNHLTANPQILPFVLQPFMQDATDVRVIIISDYLESYWRKNPFSFRNNLHFGGKSGVYNLDKQQLELCRHIMKRGKFPFAHIDLLVTPENQTWFGEISLKGGIRGAKITTSEYNKLIEKIYSEAIKAHKK